MTREREPTLEELLNDTLVRQVMAIDGYSPDDFRSLFKEGGIARESRRLYPQISDRPRPGSCPRFALPRCERRKPVASRSTPSQTAFVVHC